MYNAYNLNLYDERRQNIAKKISLPDVSSLLIGKGWEPIDAWDDIMIYRRPKEENVYDEVTLPKQVDEYYASHMLEAALCASLYEKRSVDDVLTQWSRPRFDHAKFRLVSPNVEDGAAPLYYVRALLDGVFSTLRSAVKDVEQPERRHCRARSSYIDELMKQAEFGQTEKGSYVVNVLIPCQTSKIRSEDKQAPVYRRGVEHLLRTLDSVARYAESDAPERFLDSEESAGVSANLLESILKTRGEEDAELEVSVDWSPLLAPSPGTPDRVYFKKEHASFLRDWARAWSPKERDETKRFTGVVLALDARYREGADEKPYGRVVFKIFDDDAFFEADALLEVDDFKVAYDAFYTNDELSLEGRFVVKNDKAILSGVTNVRRV